MKKYIAKLFLLVACASFVFTSCSKDAEGALYNPEELAVSFASTVQIAEVTSANNGKVSVPVYRANAKGDASVKISFADESGLFTLVSSEAKFEDGKNQTSVEVTFDFNKLVEKQKYETVLSIENAGSVSVGGEGQLTLVVVR